MLDIRSLCLERLWVHLWVLRLELVLKPLLHSGQMCGFSPVWVRMCRFSKLGRSNVWSDASTSGASFTQLNGQFVTASVATNKRRAIAVEA